VGGPEDSGGDLQRRAAETAEYVVGQRRRDEGEPVRVDHPFVSGSRHAGQPAEARGPRERIRQVGQDQLVLVVDQVAAAVRAARHDLDGAGVGQRNRFAGGHLDDRRVGEAALLLAGQVVRPR
jgi:hypothetical protein